MARRGLGPTRSEIARAAPAPALFVRRGERPGALAPREDVTRFTWSAPGVGALTGGGATSSATGPPSVAGSPAAADPPGGDGSGPESGGPESGGSHRRTGDGSIPG